MIALMLWLYIAGLVILVGSEINALLEHFPNELDQDGFPTAGACDLRGMLVREASMHGSCAFCRSSAACG
ncbi:MAG: hypothetical protein ACXW3G_10900 [Rhodoplanes sp.]